MSKRKKILLVEDDEDLRQTLTDLLEGSGYIVSQAGDGDVGQFMTLLSEFDLIISDVRMPKVDGLEMIQFIKERLSLPIILITGLSSAEVSKRFQKTKPDLVLHKPFPPSALLAAVSEYLKK